MRLTKFNSGVDCLHKALRSFSSVRSIASITVHSAYSFTMSFTTIATISNNVSFLGSNTANHIYITPKKNSSYLSSFLSKTPGIGAYPNPHLFLTLRSTTVLGCIVNVSRIRHFSSLSRQSLLSTMLCSNTQLSSFTRSMKKVTEKVAKEVAKGGSEAIESASMAPKVGSLSSSTKPESKGTSSDVKSGLPTEVLTKALPEDLYGEESLSSLGLEVKTSTQVTSSKNQDIGKEVDSRDYATKIREIKNPTGLQHADDKSPLDQHLTKHAVVYDDRSGLVEGILTSCKDFPFLNYQKLNGDPNQHFAPLSQARAIEEKHLGPVKDIPEKLVKSYEIENEAKINNILEKSGIREKVVRDIEEKS